MCVLAQRVRRLPSTHRRLRLKLALPEEDPGVLSRFELRAQYLHQPDAGLRASFAVTRKRKRRAVLASPWPSPWAAVPIEHGERRCLECRMHSSRQDLAEIGNRFFQAILQAHFGNPVH
jgi:hypothetical protein